MKDNVEFVMFKPFYEYEVVLVVNLFSFQIEFFLSVFFFFSSSNISLWKMACSLALGMGKKFSHRTHISYFAKSGNVID